MCDYSLHNVASRPAKVGDELVSTEFANTFTRGFCAIGESGVAVCLRPGTELAFEREAEFDHPLGWLMSKLHLGKSREKVARFRQVNLDRRDVHHDALEFANGKTLLVTELRRGQRVTVLQLPTLAASSEATELKAQERPANVR